MNTNRSECQYELACYRALVTELWDPLKGGRSIKVMLSLSSGAVVVFESVGGVVYPADGSDQFPTRHAPGFDPTDPYFGC